ncbi:MAG: DUF5686 family protein [Prevotella sp.]
MSAKERPDTAMLNRVFSYSHKYATTPTDTLVSYSYLRYRLSTDRRNFTLLSVPSMFVVSHGKQREYMGEAFYRLTTCGYKTLRTDRMLSSTNIPHHKRAMGVIISYLTPTIYETTIVNDYLLSPFNKENRKFYKYRVSFLLNGTARLTFKPKRDNTQLVKGEALVDYKTGRVISCSYQGEYDMLSFHVQLIMEKEGKYSLLPAICQVESQFKFCGNKVSGSYTAYFNQPAPDESILQQQGYDGEKLSKLRPDTLSDHQKQVFDLILRQEIKKDSINKTDTVKTEKHDLKYYLWDVVGDNIINRVKSHFGEANQGYIRMNPILNPLYMGYDHRRGFIYKFDIRGSYMFTPNRELTVRLKAGYSFKQKQLYYRIPIYFYFNKRKNGYVGLEIKNGNHVRNDYMRKSFEHVVPDSLLPKDFRVDEFKHNETRLTFNYDISNHFSIKTGFLYQEYTSLHKNLLHSYGWRDRYRAFAPLIELEYRPFGWTGPIITVDYDRSIKNVLRSNMSYERWEANAEYIYKFDRLQSLQMRFGAGLYTKGQHNNYFLNYENFRENNIPGGWSDEWSGEFELLNSDTYNYSEYYLRANLTYESPLLLMSWLPWVGHFIELERIYVSTLDVKSIHPYIEAGYGFTTRWLSMGVFVASRKGQFDGFGCKFGFELFRRW